MRFGVPPIPIRVLCSSDCCWRQCTSGLPLCLSQTHIFFSVNEVLGDGQATPSRNQQFHSTANLRQPGGYQHCEALARVSHDCCCHVRVCHSWVSWAQYFLKTWTILVRCLFHSWQVTWGIVSIKRHMQMLHWSDVITALFLYSLGFPDWFPFCL